MNDREKTIKEMTALRNWLLHMEEFNDYGNGDMYHEFGCTVYSALELLKEQEEKWVECKQAEHCRIIKCSRCGLSFIVGNNISYDEWIKDKNYCRRCGARMVKQQ